MLVNLRIFSVGRRLRRDWLVFYRKEKKAVYCDKAFFVHLFHGAGSNIPCSLLLGI